MGATFDPSYTVSYINSCTSKNKSTSFWNFAPNSGLRLGKSIVLLTRLEDYRACGWHLRRPTRRFWTQIVYYMSVDCHPLTLLLRFVVICCGTPSYISAAVGKILARVSPIQRIARSICGSRASCWKSFSARKSTALLFLKKDSFSCFYWTSDIIDTNGTALRTAESWVVDGAQLRVLTTETSKNC